MSPLTQLHQHIKRICHHHPWYKTLLKQDAIDPQTCQLSELPLITSDILEQHYFTGEAREEDGLSVYKTSGTSSGVRKAIYYSKEDDERYIDAKTACFQEWLTATATSTPNQHSAPIHKALADMGTGHAANTAMTIFDRLGLEADSLSFSLPIDDHIAKLESTRPELLYTMPSILDAIVSNSEEPKHFGIKKIILVGEIAPLHWQHNMAERFGIEPQHILDTYGSIEVGAIASYSHELGQYVIADGIHAEALPSELIDDHFEPLQENEAVLILTSYVRTLFPVIRYVTYDVVRDFQTICIDGRERQCFSCISKRIGTDLKHGEKISLYDIESVVHQFIHDAELRVRLRDNKLFVHIQSKSLKDEMLVHIQHAIEHKIGEIGQMIQNRMLEGISVTRAAENEQLERGTVKSKKIYS
jgi:phenylacetate-CoA ligase